MPLTFIINVHDPTEIYEFERIFHKIEINKIYNSNKLSMQNIKPVNKLNKQKSDSNISKLYESQKNVNNIIDNSGSLNLFNSKTFNPCLFDNFNVWVLKPVNSNRGRGVSVFNTIQQLNDLLID